MKSFITGISVGSIAFVLFGTVTVLIKNPFFIRMSPVHWYDYIFLVVTSILAWAYAGLWHYNKTNQNAINNKCNYAATGGTIGGFFSFGCAICNKLLIWILGLSGVIAYFMPIQHILGVISSIISGYAVYMQSKTLLKQILSLPNKLTPNAQLLQCQKRNAKAMPPAIQAQEKLLQILKPTFAPF